MPTYSVIESAFFEGKLIGGNSDRHTVNVDKPVAKKDRPRWMGDEINAPKPRKAGTPIVVPAPPVVDETDTNGVETL
tara:strand:- start:10326 stop:10556 length:231 start_codon:yes stop_codon:yes gene_type:complete